MAESLRVGKPRRTLSYKFRMPRAIYSNKVVLFGRAAWGGQKIRDRQQRFSARGRSQATAKTKPWSRCDPSRVIHLFYSISKGVRHKREPSLTFLARDEHPRLLLLNLSYTITATPITVGKTGQNMYFTDRSGVIRMDPSGSGVSVASAPIE
jgi:hypothetical protein